MGQILAQVDLKEWGENRERPWWLGGGVRGNGGVEEESRRKVLIVY